MDTQSHPQSVLNLKRHVMNTRNSVIGFIGLGAMGSRRAKRLIDAGFKALVFDRKREKVEALAVQGAAMAPTARTLAMEADVIMSCLSNDEAVMEVYGDGVISSAAPRNIIIEMSTISPETSRVLWRAGKARGLEVLDVAISGGPPLAEQGALTLLAGGSESAFNDCAPIFTTLARQYFLLGPSGTGTTMKLVVNAIMGVGMQAIAEAVALGEKLGLPRERLLNVLAQTAVIAPAQQNKLLRASVNDYSAQFPISLMNKDFRLVMERAAATAVPMPATSAAYQMNLARAARQPDEDYSSVIVEMRELARVGEGAGLAERHPKKINPAMPENGRIN
jgi:3-hydroxyisobutyrate dehydrogenase-like beta-hydroxyacid dehydrogenase